MKTRSQDKKWSAAAIVALLAAAFILGDVGVAQAANGGVVYTYDALGRVLTANYDTGVIIIYTYDANGNRTQQVINVNTKPLCLGPPTGHGNPNTWGAGLWSSAGAGC